MPQQLFAVGMSKPQLADREDSSISDLPETVEQSLLCRVPDNFQRRALRKDCHYKPSRRVSQSGSSGRPAEIHRSFSWFNVFSPVCWETQVFKWLNCCRQAHAIDIERVLQHSAYALACCWHFCIATCFIRNIKASSTFVDTSAVASCVGMGLGGRSSAT